MLVNGIERYTISDFKYYNQEAGLHFFDRSSMRFFDSRIESAAYNGPSGHYFITSERVHGSSASAPRGFTVRRFFPETGIVKSVSEFNDIGDLADARQFARAAAREGMPK